MKEASYIKVLLVCLILGLVQRVSAIITIDSAATTPSRCANDGTITVYGHSGSSMIYAIVSGPDIRVPQSGPQFGGLPQGSYQVMITNFSNDTSFIPAIVGGNYIFPDFSPSYKNPGCPGSATGIVIGNATAGSGLLPYHWTLTSISTGLTTTQAGDTFYNLAAGDYSLRMYDSCQGFATRYVTLTDPITSFSVSPPVYCNMLSCDSVDLSFLVMRTSNTWSPPFIVSTFLGGSSRVDTFSNVSDLNSYLSFNVTMGGVGVGYGSSGYAYITNGCGQTEFVPISIDPWGATVQFGPTTDSCIPRVRVYYSLSSYPFPHTNFHGPITFVVRDITAGGIIVDSSVTVNNTSYYNPTYFLEPNHYYYMTVSDQCGNLTNQYFSTPVADTASVSVTKYDDSCLDSTGGASIHCYNYSPTTINFTILSGPPLARSTKPYFAYRDTIIYPISGFRTFSCSGYAANEVCYGLGGLPEGTYRFRVEDSCGHLHIDTFVIEAADLTVYDYSRHSVKGCPGQNKIKPQIYRSRNYTQQDFLRLYPLGSQTPIDSTVSDSATFTNLNAGTYTLEHFVNRYHNFNLLSPTLSCNTLRDTIVIPPYQLPRVDYATQVKCNGTVNVGLQPDSATGVPPYNYEIVSGPLTASVQASNFFTLAQPGTYVARISDTCGFARAFTFTVDTLSFAQIVKDGSSCAGNTATLISQHSPYATYIWQKPNGGTYVGDSLRLSPVLPADYGVYHITKIVHVNGCQDTFYTTYTLMSGGTSHFFDTICARGSITFAGHTYSQAGVYFDTIHTPLCDSIAAMHLSIAPPASASEVRTICSGQSIAVGPHIYAVPGIYRDTFSTVSCDSIHVLDLRIVPPSIDSASRTICAGQSVIIGTHMYTSTGIYRDTFATAACDSVYILKLTVGSFSYDSVSQSICTGQSVAVGMHTYYATGIYRDTFATAGCDSIHILNLQVGGMKRDSVSQSICTGQSITVGPHIYNTTGVYSDTFSTTGCDSIHILDLQVGGVKRDSISQSICSGQSISVGSHTYNTAGIYRDTFSTVGCDSVHILNLQIGEAKRDSASLSICPGQTVTVGTHTYTIPGIYRDTLSTAAGCDSIHILNLQAGGVRRDSVSQSICPGQNVTVGMHTYSSTGTYRDTLSSVGGCDSIHILRLVIGGVKRDTTDVTICKGESIAIAGVTYTQAGIYSDTIATGGCDIIHSIRISVSALPDLQIIVSDTAVSPGDTVQLNVSSHSQLSYHWTSSAVLNGANRPDPTMIVDQSSWVIAQGVDGNNCIAVDSIFIKIGECEGAVFVPNAFTPNGDGRNDVYRIFGRCIRLNSLKIFNRWGEKVWDTEDINDTWDGTYRGAQQPTEVYVYIVNYSLLSDKSGVAKQMQGSITLIR